MPRRLSRLALYIGSGLALLAGITCTDSTGLRSELTQFGLAPRFTRAAEDALRNLATFNLELDNIRVRLNRGDGSTAVDTIVAVAPGAESVTIELTVRVNGSEEQFNAIIDLRAGDLILFSGTQVVTAKTSGSQSGPPVEVDYVGPGAGAVDVNVVPGEIAILSNQTAAFTAVAFDANEQALPEILVEWSVRDPALGSISDAGVFTPVPGARGSTWVIATLPTNVKDSASVTVSPIPTNAVLVSGGGQSGTVGQTISPFVFEVRAADQLPVPGAVVAFALASGGGELSATSAVAGVDGRVSVTMTLGTVVGDNVMQLLIGDEVVATASAAAIAGAAAKLVMVRQPSGTATSGSLIAVQPTVRLQDGFGNNVLTSAVPVTATVNTAAAITLTGTTTVNTDSDGVASFTDLVLVGLGGSATLTFSQGALTSATSSSIALSPSGTPALQLETSSSVTVVAGAGIEVPPSVLVRDANGNPQPGVDVRVMLTAGEATFYDQSITSDANGRVVITSLPIPTTAGSYLLTASNETYTGSPIEIQVVVQNAALAQLAFVAEPSGVAAIAGALLPPITLELFDAFGNVVTTGPTAATSVTLSLVGGTTGAILGPNPQALTQTPSAGQVTFSVSVDLAGTGYQLQASAGQAVPPVTSGTFDIAPPPAPSLTLVRGGDQANMPRRFLPDSVVVRALDASSNPMAGAIVQFAIVTGGGMLNDQSTPVDVTTDANGFAAVAWQVGAGPQSLTATMGAATQTVNAFVADRIIVVTEPSLDPQSGVKLVQQPVVRFSDAAGRVFPATEELIEAQLVRVDQGQPSGSVDFGFVTTDATGTATFTQLAVSGPITEQVQLRFFHQIDGEDPDIAAALSAPLTLRPGVAMAVIPAEFAHKLTPLVGQKTLTFTVNDGFNPVPGAPVTVSPVPTNCTLSNAPSVTDAAGKVTVQVTAGAAFTSCRVMVQVNQEPFFATNWQRVYSADVTIPVWSGGKVDDPDPAGWNVDANWFDGRVPTDDPIVFIPGSVDQVPRADGPLAVMTLHMESFASVNLNGQPLTVAVSLEGGGILQGAGEVTLTAPVGGIVNAITDGNLKIGPTGSTQCSPSTAAYTVTSAVQVGGTLEINCILLVNPGTTVITTGDLVVAPAMSTVGLQSAGAVLVGRDAQFNLGASAVFDGSLSVTGKLNVAANAQFDQFKGMITVEGDATFAGSSTMQDGVLALNGSMFYTGNGDNQKFVASLPHTTLFGAAMGAPVISWNPTAQGTSKFGRIQLLDRTAEGYKLVTDNTQTVPLAVDDLFVSDGAQLTVNPFFDLTVGGAPGLGVNVAASGGLTNNGVNITVPNAEQPGCSPLPRGVVIPLPFVCTSR